MLLVVDVGNTNTVMGVYDGDSLRADWRIETNSSRTADEYALLALDGCCRRWLKVAPVVVGPGIKTGMPILTENPREVGADRIVNSVAAFERFKSGCIIVDFGTATTFDVVSVKGEYLGGAIVPGVLISADALYHAA